MTRTAGTSTRHMQAFVVAVAAIVTAWILVRTWHGPRITGDSHFYVSTAENLADGKGLLRFSHYWESHFAPGYPVVLAGFELLGISAREGSRWLNAALYGGTILLAGLWLETFCRKRLPVVAAVLAMASFTEWHTAASGYNSEPLYLALTVACLVMLGASIGPPPAETCGCWLRQPVSPVLPRLPAGSASR